MVVRSAIKILKGTGPLEFLNALSDALNSKVLTRRLSQRTGNSSISDAGLYPAFCLLASRNDRVFDRFRRSLIYRIILEHVNIDQGHEYLKEIEQGGRMLDQLRPLLESDTIGGPIKYRYGSYGLVSPSTLRYIKVATDLGNLFGPLDSLKIAEIGVGYGGQCRVVCALWPVKSYILFDIPEVLALSRRFLEESDVESSVISERDGRNPHTDDVDLIISNYAFSELRREIQEQYFEQIIKHTSRGYVTYNHLTPPEFQSLTAYEFAERIPGARVLPERPKTHDGNVIVVWGLNAKDSPAS